MSEDGDCRIVMSYWECGDEVCDCSSIHVGKQVFSRKEWGARTRAHPQHRGWLPVETLDEIFKTDGERITGSEYAAMAKRHGLKFDGSDGIPWERRLERPCAEEEKP